MTENTDSRYEQGWKQLKEIHAEAGQQILDSLGEVAPDLVKYIIEFPFGDIYTRPGLTLKERQIITVSILASQGNSESILQAHMHGALNVGCTREELLEICLQVAIYAGFPAALKAALAAKTVFAERDAVKEKKQEKENF